MKRRSRARKLRPNDSRLVTKMRVHIYSEKGTKTESTMELPKGIFEIKPNPPGLRQYLHVYQINQRRGTAATKTRADVSGGGRKPWAQKGTGRARHGSIRSPIWVGGGVTFGPQPRDFAASLPKKIRNLALRSALSEKAASGRIFVVGEFSPKEPKTSLAAQLLRRLNAKKPLVVIPERDPKVWRSFRNIPEVVLTTAATLNPYEVVRSGGVVFLKRSVELLKDRLGEKSGRQASAKKVSELKSAKKIFPAKRPVRRSRKR